MRLKNILLFSILVFLVSSQFAWGFGIENRCINETHLQKTAEIYINDELYILNQTMYCEYGCYYGNCRESPLMASGLFFFLMLGFSLFLVTRKDIVFSLLGSFSFLVLGVLIISQGLFFFTDYINNNLTLLFGLILIGISIYKIYAKLT